MSDEAELNRLIGPVSEAIYLGDPIFDENDDGAGPVPLDVIAELHPEHAAVVHGQAVAAIRAMQAERRRRGREIMHNVFDD